MTRTYLACWQGNFGLERRVRESRRSNLIDMYDRKDQRSRDAKTGGMSQHKHIRVRMPSVTGPERALRDARRWQGLGYAATLATHLNQLKRGPESWVRWRLRSGGQVSGAENTWVTRGTTMATAARREYGAWRAVQHAAAQAVERGDLPEAAIAAINRLAGRCPVRLELVDGHTAVHASADPRAQPLETLWWLIVHDGLDRLRRCRQCRSWFPDMTRNASQVWCSARCRDRGWNRAKRREARHSQYRKKQRGSIKR
jgi:hypothetical protein